MTGHAAVAIRHLRVLVVDDNKVNQMLLTALLSRLGHAVEVAADGPEAVRLAEGGGFDLVLMDHQMPGMTGCEATRAIHARPGCGRLPVVGVTADGAPEQDLRAAGMAAVVAKPIRREELLRAIDACLTHPAHDWRPLAAPPAVSPCACGCTGGEPEVRDFLARLDRAAL